MKTFMCDYRRELFQIFCLIVCFIVPIWLDFASKIKTILDSQAITIENAHYYYLMKSGNTVIGVSLLLYVLIKFIRKSNKEKIFNKGNFYHSGCYFWYLFCATVLGYKKCNLILTPLYMQYKLILRDTFEQYPFDDFAFPTKECNINIEKVSYDASLSIINLVIKDTYDIKKEQIPSYNQINMICIKRDGNNGERVYCKELVDAIIDQIRNLNDQITLNIFATTNPKNTYEIVTKAIKLADRGNIKHLNVFQQNKDKERKFDNKSYKII